MTLKSWQPPQTIRFTSLTPLTASISGFVLTSSACAAASEALSLSADHLQRHSRATVSKSTPSTIVGMTLTAGSLFADVDRHVSNRYVKSLCEPN